MVAAQDAPAYLVLPGNSLEILSSFGEGTIDSIVTDPPYGLSNTDLAHVVDALTHWLAGDRAYVPDVGGGGFMGKAWDSFVPPPAVWDECFRVLKPGGHLLSFAGTRTIGLMEMSIRLARFDIRDSIAWLYGSGFPKSLDVSKAIDKAAGATRTEVVGKGWHASTRAAEGVTMGRFAEEYQPGDAAIGRDQFAPATPEAEQWAGWGTALKPAFEPVVVARKPFKGTVAANVLAHGTGALNIDGCRIGTEGGGTVCTLRDENGKCRGHANAGRSTSGETFHGPDTSGGRWPANVVLDADQAAALDEQSGFRRPGERPASAGITSTPGYSGGLLPVERAAREVMDGGGASRFFLNVEPDTEPQPEPPKGRWPANVVLDADQAAALDEQSGTLTSGKVKAGGFSGPYKAEVFGAYARNEIREETVYGDSGGASRFFRVVSSTIETWEQPGERPTKAESTSVGRSPASIDSDSRTGGSGNPSTGQSLQDSTSTTETTTHSTTTSPTCSCSLPVSTKTTTDETAKTTLTSTESSIDAANVALNTDRCKSSQCARPALDRDTASPVSASTFESGANETANTPTNTCAPIDSEMLTRFKYCAKAPKKERPVVTDEDGKTHSHATVKPLTLMRWLVKLVTPPGGTILDPFAGSGTTIEAALLEDFKVIGIERETDYLPMIQQRIARCLDS